MDNKKTFDNNVLIRLDGENDKVGNLYIDTTYAPEMHTTVTGTICGVPTKLRYTGKANDGMPWLCDMEVRCGDRVVIYYLAVVNALNKQSGGKSFVENGHRYIVTPYHNLFAVINPGSVVPVNGYVLIEPVEDPFVTAQKERYSKIGIELVTQQKKSVTEVCFGKVRYVGTPNKEYPDEGMTDEGCDIAVGDTVVLKRVSDVPLCYELHSKVEQGRKLWRVQRRNMLAKTISNGFRER